MGIPKETDLSEFFERIKFYRYSRLTCVAVQNECGGNLCSGETSVSKTFTPDSFWSVSFVIQAEKRGAIVGRILQVENPQQGCTI